MVVLVYSDKCNHSIDTINFIRSNPSLGPVVKYHNVNTHGAPKGVTRVPTLITDDGKLLIGGEVKNYLYSILPNTIESTNFGSKMSGCTLDGSNDCDDMFSLESYGTSLAPVMTRELEDKINRSVQDAYQSIKK
jgi:hypothetical protein